MDDPQLPDPKFDLRFDFEVRAEYMRLKAAGVQSHSHAHDGVMETAYNIVKERWEAIGETIPAASFSRATQRENRLFNKIFPGMP